jgi:PTS system mannose-specific IIB component/fructoselysine and glucoselysine-specific PTS system IIB component
LGFIALVDDEVAASDWEQELYRMGVPPEMDVYFASVQQAAGQLEAWRRDERPGILLTGDIDTMRRLVELSNGIRAINLGGIHHRAGRLERLRYIYLTPEEEQTLRSLEARGVAISAQDVPSARPLPLSDLLMGGVAQKR